MRYYLADMFGTLTLSPLILGNGVIVRKASRISLGLSTVDGSGGQTSTILPQAKFFVDLAA